MKTFAIILVTLLCNTLALECDAESLYEKMQQGRELYEQEKFDESLNAFLDAQIEHPENPKLKYNIASSHYRMGNYEEAVKGYLDVAATAQDAQLEEKSLYNIGNAKYRQGQLEEAVEYYKKALALDPKDEDVKKNLEFVREEIKRRLNEAKQTEQQCKMPRDSRQQEQKQQDQQQKQQEQKQQDQQDQQQGQNQQDQQQQEQKQQDQQQQGQEQQPQSADGDSKQKDEQELQQAAEEQAEDQPEGSPSGSARRMTEKEAEQWLNSIEENRDKFTKQDQKGRAGRAPRSAKDW